MSLRYDAGEVITAMVTPFTKDRKIDYAAAEKLASYLVDNGSDALLVAGTTGEAPTLTHEEELEMLAVVKKAVSNRAKVVMGAGSNSTETAITMSKKVEKAGADAILTVVPYYNKPSQKGMMTHFGQIAEAVDLPLILYNIPGRCVVNMLPSTIGQLAEKHQNIVAVKQSNGDLDQVTEIVMETPDDFAIYSGDDSLTLPMLSLGAHGVISVASHLFGNDIKKMITTFKSGEVQVAQSILECYYPIFKKLFMAPNPTPVKASLEKWGLITDTVRSPLAELSDAEKTELFEVLNKFEKPSI